MSIEETWVDRLRNRAILPVFCFILFLAATIG